MDSVGKRGYIRNCGAARHTYIGSALFEVVVRKEGENDTSAISFSYFSTKVKRDELNTDRSLAMCGF